MNWSGLAILLTEGLALAVAMVAWSTARRIRRPPRRTYASAVARGRPGDPGEMPSPREFEEWSFEWRGVSLPVWDIAGDNPTGPVIVCTPGWGDSRLGALTRLEALAPHALRVIAWDPPGLGEAPNWPRGLFGGWTMGVHDPEALRTLLARVGAERVVLYGWSAGAGTSIVAAAEPPYPAASPPPSPTGRGWDGSRVVGVIAEAPYRLAWTPARNVLRLMRMPWTVVGPLAFAGMGVRLGVGPRWRRFDRAAHARRVECPLLVLHGRDDEVCPIEDGEAIAHAAPHGRIVVLEGGHHNDLWTDDRFREQSTRAVREFLTSAPAR